MNRTGLRWLMAGVALIGLGLLAIAAAWLGPDLFSRRLAAGLFSCYVALLLSPIVYFSGWRASVLKQSILADYQEQRAREAEAIARAEIAERSWMGEPAESADDEARQLALDLLRASVAHPDYPAEGRVIAPASAIGWTGRDWQGAVDSLRPHLITLRGGRGGGGTVVRDGTVGALLAAIESGEAEVGE